jgi:hypothetical protein
MICLAVRNVFKPSIERTRLKEMWLEWLAFVNYTATKETWAKDNGAYVIVLTSGNRPEREEANGSINGER